MPSAGDVALKGIDTANTVPNTEKRKGKLMDQKEARTIPKNLN